MRTLLCLATLLSLVTPSLSAQSAGAGRAGPRAVLERTHEIALARSAAPGSVAKAAAVWIFDGTRYALAEEGASGAACLVSRSWPEALEPECFDAEAAATIMPMEMKRVELLHAGMPSDEVERRIADGLLDGTFRLPARLAVVYMMSEGQRLISDDGTPVGNWQPHLMLYSPFLTNEAVGHHGEPGLNGGVVVDPGRPTANLMVVVPTFVPVEAGGGSP